MIWESNKNYVDDHNKYAEELGFTLKMNKFADLVCKHETVAWSNIIYWYVCNRSVNQLHAINYNIMCRSQVNL